jgi:hypothetical protein
MQRTTAFCLRLIQSGDLKLKSQKKDEARTLAFSGTGSWKGILLL